MDESDHDASHSAVGASHSIDALLDHLSVVLLEDDDLVRMVIRHHLETWRCRTFEAHSFEQALAHLRTVSPLGLLITDVVVESEVRGPQIVRSARELHERLPVLHVSAYPYELLLQRGWIEAGAAVLEKPFSAEQLRNAVRSVVRHSI